MALSTNNVRILFGLHYQYGLQLTFLVSMSLHYFNVSTYSSWCPLISIQCCLTFTIFSAFPICIYLSCVHLSFPLRPPSSFLSFPVGPHNFRSNEICLTSRHASRSRKREERERESCRWGETDWGRRRIAQLSSTGQYCWTVGLSEWNYYCSVL